MDVKVTALEGKAIIRLEGRFDFNAHREFRDAVDSAMQMDGVREIHLDLFKVAYLDSSALGMLLMLRDKAQSKNYRVQLTNCSTAVRQVLEIANFSKLFTIC